MAGLAESQKERFSRAFITAAACASAAEFNCYPPPDDIEGIDMVVSCQGITLDFQLKATTVPIDKGDCFGFDLDVRTYDLLRNTARSGMAFLCLIVLHKDTGSWVTMSDAGTTLAHHAYYFQLHGLPPTENASTIRLSIPKANQLTPEAMRQLMNASRDRFTP